MAVPIWTDGYRAIDRVNRLFASRLELRYVGFRVHGEESDKGAPMRFRAMAAIWPHPLTEVPTGDTSTWVGSVGTYHYEILALSLSGQLVPKMMRQYRRIVLEAQLNERTMANQAESWAIWQAFSEPVRMLHRLTTEAGARADDVPLVFLWIQEVTGSDRLYTQLWHPSTLPSQFALEELKALYRQHVGSQN